MKAVMIGAGNVATNLVRALSATGIEVVQVYSHTLAHARELADTVNAGATDDLSALEMGADIYIISVKDDAIVNVVSSIPDNGALWVHTSGSIPMTVFEGRRQRYGVFYPMQSFSKQIATDFTEVPFFIEAVNDGVALEIEALAQRLSQRVFHATSEQRRRLHIAAVFACNFANHCYALSAEVLEKEGIPFDVMLPLIDETARKVHRIAPQKAQTGPAVRYDRNVIDKQMDLLADDEGLQGLYGLMSRSIHRLALQKERK